MGTQRIAIMQPYFFPYAGYFALIKHCERFILFDTPQFIKQGWIERNRILSPHGGWQYFRVPLLKHPHNTPIHDVQIDNRTDWQTVILSQIGHYKQVAPHYRTVRELVIHLFHRKYDYIVDLNEQSIKLICEYLDIKTPIDVLSRMGLSVEQAPCPDGWALNICQALGNVGEYVNATGGQSFYCRDKYRQAGIPILFQQPALLEYRQATECFEPDLSILDVLLFNDAQHVNGLLDRYRYA